MNGYNSRNDYPEYEPAYEPDKIIHKRRQSDSSRIKFDTSINVGNVIAVIGLIISILISYNGIIARMIVMENKVDLMWSKFEIGIRKE